MKKVLSLLWILLFSVCISAQSEFVSREMKELAAASRSPLLKSHSEVILIDETPWERVYGESEFILTPSAADFDVYFKELKKLSERHGGGQLMRFTFYNVVLNSGASEKLVQFGIRVPSYFERSIIKVMLPMCHAAELSRSGVEIEEDLEYGKSEFHRNIESSSVDVVFFSEGFEVEVVPGDLYLSSTQGSTNCGWGDENCKSYEGNWSVWCSDNGSGCNSCSNGSSHVNGISSVIQPVNWIPVSNYTNKLFSYMIWSDLNDLDFTDVLNRYYAFNNATNFSLSTDIFYSYSSIDEVGWSLRTASITGGVNYKFGFQFVSDGSFSSDGVYLDDLKMTGTLLTSVENNMQMTGSIFPNPAKDIIQVSSHLTLSNLDIYDISGRHVMNAQNSKVLNVSSLNPGVYVVKMKVGDNVITDRFIKE